MRTPQLVTLAVLVVVVGAVAAVVVGPVSVSTPPRDASPVAYTNAYLRAAEDQDCALTRRLTTSHTFAWCGGWRGWLQGTPDLVGHRDVATRAYAVGPPGADRQQECVASTIDQRGMTGAEDGTLPWNWCWVRTPDGWRLWDQGQG